MGFSAVNRDTVCRNFALCVCNVLNLMKSNRVNRKFRPQVYRFRRQFVLNDGKTVDISFRFFIITCVAGRKAAV